MKLWKKILIGICILAVIVFGLVGFGIFKAHQAYTEKIVPDMERYVTMTQQEQDRYVMSKLGELYAFAYQVNDSASEKAILDAVQSDPAARQAGLAWGRAVCANIIKNDKDIAPTLSAADRAKYEKEADDLHEKGERWKKELERFAPKKK